MFTTELNLYRYTCICVGIRVYVASVRDIVAAVTSFINTLKSQRHEIVCFAF